MVAVQLIVELDFRLEMIEVEVEFALLVVLL
jgi:hypothetical protein